MMNILSLHVDYKIIYKVLLLSGKVIRCIESMPFSSVLSRPCPREGKKKGLERSAKTKEAQNLPWVRASVIFKFIYVSLPFHQRTSGNPWVWVFRTAFVLW